MMLVGLQGSGKTTTTGKLAKYFKDDGKRVLLVAADPRRPAAGEQLASLGAELDVPVHRGTNEGDADAGYPQRSGITIQNHSARASGLSCTRSTTRSQSGTTWITSSVR